MPRVVPSQIVAFIDQAFPWAANQIVGAGTNLLRQNSGPLAGLLELLDRVPDELITVNGAPYNSLVTSAAAYISPPQRLICDIQYTRRFFFWSALQTASTNIPNRLVGF